MCPHPPFLGLKFFPQTIVVVDLRYAVFHLLLAIKIAHIRFLTLITVVSLAIAPLVKISILVSGHQGC